MQRENDAVQKDSGLLPVFTSVAKHRVTRLVQGAKSCFFTSKILECTASKQVYNTTSSLFGKSKIDPLPTVFSPAELPGKFSDYFSGRICIIRDKLGIA